MTCVETYDAFIGDLLHKALYWSKGYPSLRSQWCHHNYG